MVFVVIKIITQELEIESNLKQRLEFICDFCHIKPTIINGSIRKIDKTNLSFEIQIPIFNLHNHFLII